MSSVTLEEADVLQILRDFLEEGGYAECLGALERSAAIAPHGLPTELRFVRELVLSGRWEELIKFLQPLSKLKEEGEFVKCHYAVVRQQYLESLVWESNVECKEGDSTGRENKRLQNIVAHLQQLEQLCPTKEDYSNLCYLLTVPSFTAHSKYSNWSMHSARLECFYTVGSWVARVLYPGLTLKLSSVSRELASNRLIRLLAKGLLYEECESVCSQRCGVAGTTSEIMNLCSWLQHQPDSAFQVAPTQLSLIAVRHSQKRAENDSPRGVSPLSKSLTIAPEGLNLLQARQTLVSRSVPELQMADTLMVAEEQKNTRDEKQQDPVTKSVKGTVDSQESILKTTLENKPTETRSDPEGVCDVATSIKTTHKKVSFPDLYTHQEVSPGPPHPETEAPQSPTQVLKLRDDKLPSENHPSQVTPPQNTPLVPRSKGAGRNSSTPKPSTYHLPSPTSSPVPYVPGTHGLNDTHYKPVQDCKETTANDEAGPSTECPLEISVQTNGPRKQIDFTDSDDSVKWPTAELLCSVSDPQVVRSVAFTHTGEIVAIGANSKALRLCSALPLLSQKPRSDELAVFYYHPRYHRGSIYCLSWLGDSLLASGSNDQTIKLLSHNPASSSSPCTPQGQLTVHNGTVRDLIFLPNGHLLSGGGGDSALKLSDSSSAMLVSSYVGHTDQILALAVVDETVVTSASQDKTVKLWDTRQPRCFHTFSLTHPAASMSSRNDHLATSQLDGSCDVYDLRTLKCLGTVHPHSEECRTVRFTAASPWLLTGSYDGSVCLVDTTSMEWQEVAKHNDRVIQCRWHRSGKVFASTGTDKKACFWALQ